MKNIHNLYVENNLLGVIPKILFFLYVYTIAYKRIP